MSLKIFALNCTLKASPEMSNTQALLDKVLKLYTEQGHQCTSERAADLKLPPGIVADAGHGDQWPELLKKIKAADIFILATPIWMGVHCSIAQLVIERLNGSVEDTNSLGQSPFFNKVAGCVVTGNEDGAHNAAGVTLYNLTHLGFAVPPLADCYWVNDAGPGDSYIKADGDHHLYANRTARYLVHGTIHMAQILRDKPFPHDINQLDEQASKTSKASQ